MYSRILAVDDNEVSNKVLKRTLDRLFPNNPLTQTTLGKEFIKEAKKGNYELWIMDQRLPDILGTEILTQLRTERFLTPALILTGEYLPSIEKILKSNHGNVNYELLQKPYELEPFKETINRLLIPQDTQILSHP
ncbi:hypothetical protein COU54_02305 [Candidatus Pacearchaeota archaeon CG10_big_fil_rev_8_21_14_0_10_31_24]|nr:MAG: hypothetical protein COU54_02305 [Candidatus Pacearchaeota archaeon CG10_big_fil_rev_8_21_14_0_10_31_24]